MWLVVSALAALALFLGSRTEITLASHDAELRPTLSWSGPGEVVVHTGPVLPDVRTPAPGRVGVDITLGKTDATTTAALVKRYAVLAGAPEGQIAKVASAVTGLAVRAALRGLVLGALPVLVWLLIGASRRHELVRHSRRPEGLIVVGAVAGIPALAVIFGPGLGMPTLLLPLFGILLWGFTVLTAAMSGGEETSSGEERTELERLRRELAELGLL